MTETSLVHNGVKGMKWGVRKEGSSSSDRQAVRKQKQILRGEAKLYKRSSFGSSNSAIGSAAVGVILSGVSAGRAIKLARDPRFAQFKSLNKGIAVVSTVLAGVTAAKTVHDIRDIRAYEKDREASNGQ